MMDALLKTALLGVARQEVGPLQAGTPIDGLTGALEKKDRARTLLLAAGALAVYRQAGYVPDSASGAVEPSPLERRRTLSPRAASLVATMLAGTHDDVLPEALDRMRRAGLVLPPALLPAALDARLNHTREALLPVIGERGRWLGRFNPAWRWAADGSAAGDGVVDDVETVWNEGTPAQRLEVLRRVRRADPERARAWVRGAWTAEKADYRTELLGTLADRLSPDDEALLESALDDRSGAVRKAAAGLLARLPDSAFLARMTGRADTMLAFQSRAAGGGLRARLTAISGDASRGGHLVVTPPTAVDPQWQRDGIDVRAPGGQDERAWRLRGVLSYVPPSHWEERFGVTPADLVEAARRAAWNRAVYEGWSHAAALHVDGRWAAVLHDWWAQDTSSENTYGLHTLRALLIRVMPPHELEARALRGVAGTGSAEVADWDEMLASIPTPWSVPFGTQVLHGLRDAVRTARRARTSHPRVWSRALAHAALALPPACLVQALEPWDLPQPEANDWHLHEWHRQLKAFTDTISIRQQVVKEVPV